MYHLTARLWNTGLIGQFSCFSIEFLILICCSRLQLYGCTQVARNINKILDEKCLLPLRRSARRQVGSQQSAFAKDANC